MTSFPPLYILRHGETEWNATGRLQGSFDSELTARGRAQALAQQQILADITLHGFQALCSPQLRARETAEIALVGHGLELSQDVALREIGLGDFAGKDRESLVAQTGARDGFDLYALAPGGEGFDALEQRCCAFLAGLKGPAVLVTHGITSRMLRLIATGQPVTELREIGGGQGVVFQVQDGVQKRLSLRA